MRSHVWFKHKSSKRNMFYYYNIETRESVWELPEGEEFIDKTEESLVKIPEKPSINQKIVSGERLKIVTSPKQNLKSSSDEGLHNIHKQTASSSEVSCGKQTLSPEDDKAMKMIKRSGLKLNFSLCEPLKKIKNEMEQVSPTGSKRTSKENVYSSVKDIIDPLLKDRTLSTFKNMDEKKDHCGIDLVPATRKRKLSHSQGKVKRQKPESETVSSCRFNPPSTSLSNIDNNIFDLRMKLQHRTKELSKVNDVSFTSSHSEMEWEDIDQSDPSMLQDNSTVPKQISEEHYRKIYLVCDTSALLDDSSFVEKLISKGIFLGLCVKIVIPFVVFSELDKLKMNEKIGHEARKISRIINSSQENDNLHLQEGHKSRDPVGSLDLNVNDDLVLNCCLQTRDHCKEGELAILMTYDNNLANKALSFKLDTHKWTSFKKWARGYRERKRLSERENGSNIMQAISTEIQHNYYTDESMDVDSSVSVMETHASMESELQNCIHSNLRELKAEFQTFLHNVINEALNQQYGELKNFSNNIKPSWTLINYIIEARKRWFLITSSNPSKKIQDLFSQLVALTKKCNSGKEELTREDVENMFTLCESLTHLILKTYKKLSTIFLQRLNDLKQDWEVAQSNVSDVNTRSISVEDLLIQPVDIALSNILSRLNSDYEDLEKDVEGVANKDKSDIEDRLTIFFESISKLVKGLQNAFQEKPKRLNCANKNVTQLHKLINNFSNGRGSSFDFQLTTDNVVEFFQDTSYRKNLKYHLDSFLQRQIQVQKLITSVKGK